MLIFFPLIAPLVREHFSEMLQRSLPQNLDLKIQTSRRIKFHGRILAGCHKKFSGLKSHEKPPGSSHYKIALFHLTPGFQP